MIFSNHLNSRCLQSELMDDPGIDRDAHFTALRGLARVNRTCGTARLLWKSVQSHLARPEKSPLTILDIACGGGDVAMDLAKLAKKASWPARIEGADISSQAIEFAESQARNAQVEVEFRRQDALELPARPIADVVYSSLFLHHLPNETAVQVISKMRAAARRLVLVQDLIRSRLGFLYAWSGVRLLTRSRICHVDGPLSVRSAFTPDELQSLAIRAGMKSARVSRHWPQRMLLSWRRHDDDECRP